MDNYTKDCRSVRISAPICDRTVNTDLCADLILPDYQPEIKRLLRVSATVSAPQAYVGVGNAELSGTVDYHILYAANDGSLYSTAHKEEYSFSIPMEISSEFDLNDGLVCDSTAVAENLSGRVSAPRKLAVKCRLRSRVKLYGTLLLEEKLTGGNEATLQRLCAEASTARIFAGIGEPLQLGDEILCDPSVKDTRVIAAEGQVFVTEAVAGSGMVNCRGDLLVKLLCAQEESDAPPSVQVRRIPFTQAVTTDGVEVNCDCTACGVCSELTVSVEDGRILCEASVCLQTHAQRNETFSYTRDLYSTDAKCEAAFATCRFPTAQKCINANFSLGTALSLEEAGIRRGQSLIDISLTPYVTETEYDHGKYRLLGRCRAQAVLCEENEHTAEEFEIPFRYEIDLQDTAPTDYDVTLTPISCRARLDGERIGIEAELAVSLSTRGETRFDRLCEAKFGEKISQTGAVYTICYPARDDTLWSVAKRYHRAVDTVSKMNELSNSPAADSRDSLSGVRYLLV